MKMCKEEKKFFVNNRKTLQLLISFHIAIFVSVKIFLFFFLFFCFDFFFCMYAGRMWIVIYYRMNTISGCSLMLFCPLCVWFAISLFAYSTGFRYFLASLEMKIYGSFGNQVCSKFAIDEKFSSPNRKTRKLLVKY